MMNGLDQFRSSAVEKAKLPMAETTVRSLRSD
jgi:hypothetical protein